MKTTDFFCPGSILDVRVDNTHPAGYGMAESASGFFARSAAFELQPNNFAPGGQVRTIVKFAGEHLLQSGWILGEQHLYDRAAAADVSMQKGSRDSFRVPRPEQGAAPWNIQAVLQLPILRPRTNFPISERELRPPMKRPPIVAMLRMLAVALAASCAGGQTLYEVYGIRYATLKAYPLGGLVEGEDREHKIDIAMYVFLIKGGGRNILFDSGFYRPQFMRQWRPADYEIPSAVVERAGVKAGDITDVVLSHIHWDHADGFDLFPNAKIWIQKKELEYYAGEAWIGKKRTAADPDDIVGLVRINTEGRLGLVNGDAQQIFPGITAYTGGKHTYESQFLGVQTGTGTVVLASDNVYLYLNLEKHVPIAQSLDKESNLRAQDRMKQIASNPKLIIPGHDPALMKNFAEVAAGVVRIQ